MAMVWTDRATKDRKELDAKKAELSELQEKNRILRKQIEDSFSNTGAITRRGLENELCRLDVERRTKNPLDQGEQSLIQGQQNEIIFLLQMENTWLSMKENLLERIRELEAETQTLIERLERRRSTNDVT